MMNPARPLSRSASASQVISLPLTRTFVGAGGGVLSATAVSLTYCIQSVAIASLGNQPACSGSPANVADGTASLSVTLATHAPLVGGGWSGPPGAPGRRAFRQPSSQGMAR